MSLSKDPFDPNVCPQSGCVCGRHASTAEHDAANEETLGARAVEQTVRQPETLNEEKA